MDNYASIKEEEAGETEDGGKKKFVSVFYHSVTPTSLEMQTELKGKTEKSYLVNSTEASKPRVDIPDYLPLSILSVFLFFPFGIPAVIYSVKVRNALRRNDKDSALSCSNLALQLGLISVMVGPFLAGLTVIIVIFVMNT